MMLMAIIAMMRVLAFYHELFELLTEASSKSLSLRRTPSRGEKEGGKHVKHKGGKDVKEGREGGKQVKQVEEEVENI